MKRQMTIIMKTMIYRVTSRTLTAVLLALSLHAGWAGASTQAADTSGLRLAALFQDHMLLQRDKPIKVWGWSPAGEKITVSFGGQAETVETGTDGKWMVTLKPMKASDKGRTLKISPSNKAYHTIALSSNE